MIQSVEDGRKGAGARAIADKIIKRLHDLEKNVESNQGRWAWELLQNAKDSIAEDDDRTVSVQIQLDHDKVEFRHNGTHFTEQDVIGLINQISSKEVEEGQQTKKIGRFGTGFLTTHLLSRLIKIEGILKTVDESFYEFEFLLDRRCKKIAELIPKIENSWRDFDESVKEINSNYDKNQFNTSFCYQLDTKEQRRIAKIGVEEFSKLIPFVLAFIPEIGRVEIIDNVAKNTTSFESTEEFEDDFIVHISKTKNGEEEDILILYISNDEVGIATEVERSERRYSVKSVKSFPKLFCNFPLIGTEDFHFPVIVNSFFFNPQTERDGIWLKGIDDVEVEENQRLLESAAELYRDLVSQIAEKNFFDLYNLAETEMPSTDSRYFDEKWYRESIQKPIRELIYNAKIVELENEAAEKRAIRDVCFPMQSLPEAIREKIWQFIFDLSPNTVSKRSHLHSWCVLSWADWKLVNYKELVSELTVRGNIDKLRNDLRKAEGATFEWLNSLGNFILEDESSFLLLEKSSIIPNKNGIFKEKKYLYVDEINDDDLIEILRLLGDDWNHILLHNAINFGAYNAKKRRDIAVAITEKLKRTNSGVNTIEAINLLCEWFENNPALGEELFTDLYSKRAELFMNTIQDKESLYKVMRTCKDLSNLIKVAKVVEGDPKIIEKIKELTNLLEEFKAENISDLKSILSLAQNVLADDSKKVEITQEVLLSLGVISTDELEKVLQDKGFAAKFTHTSTPTLEMFLTVQRLIGRAKTNVIRHLNSLEDYDCTDLEELAPTVIGGIKKDGLSIYIVVRPSDNGEVIIFYSSEKDTLDNSHSELWIDNGIEEPRRLTLGKILKTTGINRIPVK